MNNKYPYACCKNCIHYQKQLKVIDYCKFHKMTINPNLLNDHCKHFVDIVERLPL